MSDESSAVKLVNWVVLEAQHGAKGAFPSADHGDEGVYAARLKKWDARLAEALTQVDGVDVLQKIRNLIMLGNLSEAETLLLQTTSHPAGEGELILERARLAGYQGQWENCIQLTTQALTADLTVISQMSVLNARSVAFFELGHFAAALMDCEKLASLSKIFPYLTAGIYGHVLKIKILARLQSIEVGERMLAKFFEDMRAASLLNPDVLVAYLRTKIDLKRLKGETTFREAGACYLISQKMGDGVYEALSFFDIFLCVNIEDRKCLTKRLEIYRSRFEKLDQIMNSWEGGVKKLATTTTAQTMHRFLVPQSIDSLKPVYENAESINKIACLQEELVFNLTNFEMSTNKKSEQLFSAVAAMNFKPQSSADLFSCIWGAQKYSEELHGNLVRSLLTRIRKDLGIQVKTKKKLITLENVWVV